MASFNLLVRLLAQADSPASSNPQLQHVNWTRKIDGWSVGHPEGARQFEIPSQASATLFDGTRSLSTDGTTTFTVTLSPLDGSRYRFTWAGGTNPVLRTNRALTLSGSTIVCVVNANGTLTMTPSAGSLAAVQAGDVVLVPGVVTGDAVGPFNALNTGFWSVVSATASAMVLTRLAGETFEGASEAVVLTANSQLQAFSAAGVQIGDRVDLSSTNWAVANRRTLPVVSVTPGYFEVESTLPLALDAGVAPGAAGITFFTAGKDLVYLEADGEAAVQANGDTGTTQRLGPIGPGDSSRPAVFLKSGPTWKLIVVNRGTTTLRVVLVAVEA